jgi:hypothetical protein
MTQTLYAHMNKRKSLLLTGLEAGKSKFKVSVDSVLVRACSSQMVSSMCPSMVEEANEQTSSLEGRSFQRTPSS